MTVYDLKPAFQDRLRPLVRALAARGVRPNAVTWAALALSLVAGALLALFPTSRACLLLIPAALLARMALNAVDGMLAREHGMATPLGALLNELGDVASDAALYLPFALATNSALPVVIVVLAALSEVAGIAARTVGASRRYDGPGGKSDRALAFGALALLLAFWTPPRALLEFVWVVLTALVALTVRNRVRGALRERVERAVGETDDETADDGDAERAS